MQVEENDFLRDVATIGNLPVIPLLLKIAARTTNMGFVAVARVTPERWVACQVHDGINFGLLPGGELKVDTTICHEIRQTGEEVIIDDVSQDQVFWNHHTPAMYGFKSYISVPINLRNGYFFGTLCAIDPSANILRKPEIRGIFQIFSNIISLMLDASEHATTGELQELNKYAVSGLSKVFEQSSQPAGASFLAINQEQTAMTGKAETPAYIAKALQDIDTQLRHLLPFTAIQKTA